MKLISHRGNLNGPDPNKENTVEYILAAIYNEFDCEIDIWKIDDTLYLGHDQPDNIVSLSFLEKYNNKLWIHCKNVPALVFLKDTFNCFYHKDDEYTLTSKGYIWGNIHSYVDKNVIAVMPELTNKCINNSAGICSDYIMNYTI